MEQKVNAQQRKGEVTGPFLHAINELAFKKIFGYPDRKACLIDFLNSVLERTEKNRIVDITYLPSKEVPAINGFQYTLIDVHCQDAQGEEYIVEMQLAATDFFGQRVLYPADVYVKQPSRGDHCKKPSKVIFLGILDFELAAGGPDYLSYHCIKNRKTHQQEIDGSEFVFIELPKFNKGADELTSPADQWVYFLKYASQVDRLPDTITSPSIHEAFGVLSSHNWSEEE